MEQRSVYVGLDYHQKSVQVCVVDVTGRVLRNRACPNDAAAIASAVRTCGRVAGAAIEACCGAADLAERLVAEHAWSVDLAHPGYVARLKQSPDKSDHSDARLLADLERVGYVPRVWQAPRQTRELRQLVRYRDGLVRQRRAAKQRIGAVLREHRIQTPRGMARWTRAWITWVATIDTVGAHSRWVIDELLAHLDDVARRIRAAERRLRDATRQDPICGHLLTMAGIGEVTAWVIRAEIGRFDRFRSGKQLARFCGLSPRNASSGQRDVQTGLIKAGSPMLRSILIEAAHRLARHDERWSALARRLREKGKKPSVAIAAIANRWVRWLYHQMREAVRPAL